MGDFLGLDKPLKPGTGERPAIAGRPTTLPANTRPGRLPGAANRPGSGSRPGVANRPNFGNGWNSNRVINRQPSWAKIDRTTNVDIHNRWNTAFTSPSNGGWRTPANNRLSYWRGWGDGVRHGWGHYHHHGRWFNDSWWGLHPHAVCGWHYHYGNHNRRWNYWWTVPAWGTVNNWFAWQAPANVWSEPVYYDYGSEGNVVYQDSRVYIGGTEVASTEEFAQSAMALATVDPPASEEEAAESEWLPLGTFTVSSSERDTDPNLTVQLAVNRQGVVAGTLYNSETDEAQSLQGAVDRETQRVAIRFGERETLVAETGLYNLTQEEAPVLVHFAADKTENYLLVRLDAPEEDNATESK